MLPSSNQQAVLVEIRCKARDCGRVLYSVDRAPAANDEQEWAELTYVAICPRHGDGAGEGYVQPWQERQRQAGKDPNQRRTGEYICWSELRPAIDKARRTGKMQKHAR